MSLWRRFKMWWEARCRAKAMRRAEWDMLLHGSAYWMETGKWWRPMKRFRP